MRLRSNVRMVSVLAVAGSAWWVGVGCGGEETHETVVNGGCGQGTTMNSDGLCVPLDSLDAGTGGTGGGSGGSGGEDASAGSGGSDAGTGGTAGLGGGGGTAGESGSGGNGGVAGSAGGGGLGGSAGSAGGAGVGGAAGFGASGLDPRLVLSDPDGEPCDLPGQPQCDDHKACRISSPTSGTCDAWNPACPTVSFCPPHQPCTDNWDCWAQQQCFDNGCRTVCKLGSDTCDEGETCVDVGHFERGVCMP
jgi:hypothetical protein